MDEEWKWIKGFEGQYQISNYGRVKSFKKTKGGYILSNQNATGDYLRIVLRNSVTNKKKSIAIHQLVAEHFIGDRPQGYQVHHKDGNKQNNIVSNLEYIHPKRHRKETEKRIHKWLQELLIITNMRSQEKYANTLRMEYYSLHM